MISIITGDALQTGGTLAAFGALSVVVVRAIGDPLALGLISALAVALAFGFASSLGSAAGIIQSVSVVGVAIGVTLEWINIFRSSRRLRPETQLNSRRESVNSYEA